MRPGSQYRQLGARTAGHLHGRSTHSSCARHVPALPHANQRCRTYPQQLQLHTGPVLRIATEPRAPAAPNHKALPGCVAGSLQDAPCANIRSEASTSSPRPFFSSGSSLSGYASAATGSPGQDVNDPEAGRQHSQSKGPDQGSSPGTHKERGLAAPDFLGEVFFLLVPAARLPLSALICLSAVASRSSGAQEQPDLDPPSIHAMGGSLERMEAIDRLGATAAQRCEHARRLRCTGAS